jgi:hypothetical protein
MPLAVQVRRPRGDGGAKRGGCWGCLPALAGPAPAPVPVAPSHSTLQLAGPRGVPPRGQCADAGNVERCDAFFVPGGSPGSSPLQPIPAPARCRWTAPRTSAAPAPSWRWATRCAAAAGSASAAAPVATAAAAAAGRCTRCCTRRCTGPQRAPPGSPSRLAKQGCWELQGKVACGVAQPAAAGRCSRGSWPPATAPPPPPQALRNFLLRSRGWLVVEVPWWKWDE